MDTSVEVRRVDLANLVSGLHRISPKRLNWINQLSFSHKRKHKTLHIYLLFEWHRWLLFSGPYLFLWGKIRFPSGTRIWISILGLGVCSLYSVLCCLQRWPLYKCWPHIQGGPPLCICLVFRSTVCCSPYNYLTHGKLDCMSQGGVSPTLGRINQGRLASWRTWRACDVREAKEGLENELWRRWS